MQPLAIRIPWGVEPNDRALSLTYFLHNVSTLPLVHLEAVGEYHHAVLDEVDFFKVMKKQLIDGGSGMVGIGGAKVNCGV